MTEQKKDIFDKIMSLPLFNIFQPIYVKHKEALLYLFFGGLTTVVSIIAFFFLNVTMEMHELIANVISWIIAVTFAFFTNRVWVFAAPTKGINEFVKQAISFYAGRLVTLGIEEIILLVFITLLRFPSMLVKIVAQVLVIILNYVISKVFVFKK